MNFSTLSRGEKVVVRAGGVLLVDMAFFPWHRIPPGLTRTAIQSPNSLPGTIAFLLAVAMLAQILMARSSMSPPNRTLVRLQPVAGMAVVAALVWKLTLAAVYLSVGAYLGLVLAAGLAYGGFLVGKEVGFR